MTHRFFTLATAGLAAVTLSLPGTAAAQRTRQGAPATGAAAPRDPGPARTPGRASGGRADGGSATSGGSGPSGGDSGQRSGGGGGGTRTRAGAGDGPGGRNDGRGGDATPTYSRPREGRRATGEAVPRGPNSGGGGGTTIIVPGGYYGGGYYPWGWGGLGLAGYYGGYYDPWGYDGYQGGYSSGYGYDGGLRLKVKPREAEVFVDGYFAGEVDQFDGAFQRMHIDSGPHRIEIRLDGYEPLTFETRIQPDRTVTYKGELKRLP